MDVHPLPPLLHNRPELIAGEVERLVDELAAIDAVETRARLWLEELLQLPREPMLATRRIARAAILGAVAPERIDLPAFVARWTHPDTQAALRAMLARIGK